MGRLCRAAVAAKLAAMEELLRSNDPVYLSFVRHVLDEAGIIASDSMRYSNAEIVAAVRRAVPQVRQQLSAA